jgi:hypothetical protein
LRTYRYVGPKQIAERVRAAPVGECVESPDDVLRWVRQTNQAADTSGCVVATFVIDKTEKLRVADRRSEHVACAGGRDVLSAGEIAFTVAGGGVLVSWVTNQSTGYCPDPESWPAVHAALERAGLAAPEGFDPAFVFRRCLRCAAINVVKGGDFECDVCAAALPIEWNCTSAT